MSEAGKRRLRGRADAGLADPGRGFGLSLVRAVMESYGGAVRVRDRDPRGTVVDLVFPALD